MFYSLTLRSAARLNSLSRLIAASFLTFFFLTAGGLATNAQTYAGTGTGPITDGLGATPPQCAAPRNVSFAVSGFSNSISTVAVNFTMTPTHGSIGDLIVSLIAPDAVTSASIFGRVGAITASDPGDNSDLTGTYSFSDSASQNIWTTASTVSGGTDVPVGSYRAQAAGPGANVSPGPGFTNLNATFASVTANGTWTLRFTDCSSGATGSVSAANLVLTPVAGPTAADSSITGRVRTASGYGVGGARVTLSSGDDRGITVLTNAFGYFIFPAVESGQTYVLSVSSKRHTFAEPVQVVTVNENVAGIDFQALQ